MNNTSTLRRIIRYWSGAEPLFWLLPWFMLLTTVGTIAQRYIGLQESLSLFFSSAIVWIGIVPVPGGLTTLALIALNLLLKLILKTRWVKLQAGIIISHISVLLLLIGGALTWLLSQEGYISLLEGESTPVMQDYYARELTLWQGDTPVASWPEAELIAGKSLIIPNTQAIVTLTDVCDHCEAYKVEETDTNRLGLARELTLRAAPPPKEKEESKGGISFSLSGADEGYNGSYIATELLSSQMPKFTVDKQEYELIYTRQRHPLPFAVTLKEFEKIRYPGSSEAKEYQSLIAIDRLDGSAVEEYLIRMNEPLRIEGYTLYQSSFMRFPNGQEASVLSVVKNAGWLFPYLSGALLAIGLIWHMLIRLQLKRRATE